MYLARDKDESLWLYENRPSKGNESWECVSGDCQMLDINVFPEIKWGDNEPLELISKPIKDEENMEGYENKLKTFNLDEAKDGKPVCTRDGRNVRIICFDCKVESFPIVALVSRSFGKEEIISYDEAGYSSTREPDDRLFMLPEKKIGWINVYNKSIYNSEEDAREGITDDSDYIGTIKVEWEV